MVIMLKNPIIQLIIIIATPIYVHVNVCANFFVYVIVILGNVRVAVSNQLLTLKIQ